MARATLSLVPNSSTARSLRDPAKVSTNQASTAISSEGPVGSSRLTTSVAAMAASAARAPASRVRQVRSTGGGYDGGGRHRRRPAGEHTPDPASAGATLRRRTVGSTAVGEAQDRGLADGRPSLRGPQLLPDRPVVARAVGDRPPGRPQHQHRVPAPAVPGRRRLPRAGRADEPLPPGAGVGVAQRGVLPPATPAPGRARAAPPVRRGRRLRRPGRPRRLRDAHPRLQPRPTAPTAAPTAGRGACPCTCRPWAACCWPSATPTTRGARRPRAPRHADRARRSPRSTSCGASSTGAGAGAGRWSRARPRPDQLTVAVPVLDGEGRIYFALGMRLRRSPGEEARIDDVRVVGGGLAARLVELLIEGGSAWPRAAEPRRRRQSSSWRWSRGRPGRRSRPPSPPGTRRGTSSPGPTRRRTGPARGPTPWYSGVTATTSWAQPG